MPTVYMLVGVPGSGKTTWLNNQDVTIEDSIVGSDYVIQEVADWMGMTYTEAFPYLIKFAEYVMYKEIDNACNKGYNIYWDQTNTTRKVREEKLSRIPIHYQKVAVYFPTPDNLEERLASRPGKTIPLNVVQSMVKSLEIPMIEEGFDDIIHI